MKKKRILVVDDEATIREVLADLFKLHKIGCDGAAGPEEALSLLARNRYSLIFLDYHLGKEKAPDVIGRLREKCGPAPIVLLTGSGDLDECDPQKIGVTELVRKPFPLATVLDLVKRYLELK